MKFCFQHHNLNATELTEQNFVTSDTGEPRIPVQNALSAGVSDANVDEWTSRGTDLCQNSVVVLQR